MGDSSLAVWISVATLAIFVLSAAVALLSWRSRRKVIRIAGGSLLIVLAVVSILGPFMDVLLSLVVGPALVALGLWIMIMPR